jgi:tetratricopeptide (TPR) repeat protein
MPDTILRKKRPFVGREDLIAAFRDAVKTKKPDEHNALMYYGLAGIGKTALRYRLIEELKHIDDSSRWAFIDFKDYVDTEDALFKIRRGFKQKYKDMQFPAFDIGYAIYWSKHKSQIKLDKNVFPLWEPLAFLGKILDKLSGIPIVELSMQILKHIEKADEHLYNWFQKRGSKLLRSLPYLEESELREYLPILFSDDLVNYWEGYNYKTVILFDSYEKLWRKGLTEGTVFSNDEWIRTLVQKIPQTLFVFFGQERLRWEENEPFWKDVLVQMKLGNMVDTDIEEIIRNRGLVNEAVIKAIAQGSKGVPFAADVAADNYFRIKKENKREPVPADFEKTTDKIYRGFIEPRESSEIKALKLLSAANSWGKDIFDLLLKKFPTGYSLEYPPDLVKYSCVELIRDDADDYNKIYALHELMRKCIDENFEKDKPSYLKDIHNFLFGHYNAQLEDLEPKNIMEGHKTALREAFYHAAQSLPPDELLGWFIKAEDVFDRGAQWTLLTALYEDIKAILEGKLGPDHPDVPTILSNLANLYQSQGIYAEAEPRYKRALEITEKALGPDHPDVAATLNNLAKLYRSLGKYAEAEPLCKRSLEITEKALGPDHPDLATILNNLAALHESRGRYAEAEPLYKRSLEINEKALGPHHPSVGTMLNNLAELYKSQGRYAEAEPLCKRALEIREKALGPDHPDVGGTLNNLASLYESQGRYTEAEPLCKRALDIREKALGSDHPDVAGTLNNLANLCKYQGKYAEAEHLYKRDLEITEKALGPDHPLAATTLNNLALLYETQAKYAEAEPLCKRALEIREEALGPDHPDVADTLNNLAEMYRSQGRYAEAETLYKRSLDIAEKALGHDHSDVAATLNNLAELYRSQGRYAEAEPLYEQSLEINEKALGPDHPNVATALNNLAGLYKSQGKQAEAGPLYKQSLEISEKTLGRDHPSVATTLNNLAGLYIFQGRYEEAEPLFKRSLRILNKSFGMIHPNIATVLENMAGLCAEMGKKKEAMKHLVRAGEIRSKLQK